MAFGFYRSIWITLRAANYTGQALNDASRGLNKVQQAEVNLAKSSVQLGMMYVAMGAMAVQGMVSIMQMSERGKEVWEKFTQSISPSLERLADAFADILGEVLPFISALMNIITINPIVTRVVAGFVLFAATLMMAAGAGKALSGGLKLLGIQFGVVGTSTTQAALPLDGKWTPSALRATLATHSLGAALKMMAISALVGFGVFVALEGVVGTLPASLFALAAAFAVLAVQMWMAAGAMSVLSWGAAAVAGGAALAGAIAVATGATEYQMGTSFVKKGGLAVVHEGEEIKSARETRVKSRMEGIEAPRYAKTSWYVPITIGTVHTKSDKDTMVPLIKKALKEALDQKV